MVNDALIILVNIRLSEEKLHQIRENFAAQREQGVVVLPYYCDAIQIPKDTLIKIMDAKGDVYELGGKES